MRKINTLEDFEKAAAAPGLSCFLFTAGWCPDCVFIKPFLPEVVQSHPEITFYEVNRDEMPELCQKLQILGIPSFVCFRDGKEVSRFVSKLRKTRQEIDNYLNETERN